jgi:hypothetical protein
MICYAVALIFWGWIGDRFNPLAVVVFGMVGSAISVHFYIGFLHIFELSALIYPKPHLPVDRLRLAALLAGLLLGALVHFYLGLVRHCASLRLAQ